MPDNRIGGGGRGMQDTRGSGRGGGRGMPDNRIGGGGRGMQDTRARGGGGRGMQDTRGGGRGGGVTKWVSMTGRVDQVVYHLGSKSHGYVLADGGDKFKFYFNTVPTQHYRYIVRGSRVKFQGSSDGRYKANCVTLNESTVG